MQVKPFTYNSASCIWSLLVFGLSMTCNFNENDDSPEDTGVFFPAFHHCKAMTRSQWLWNINR